MTLITYLFIPLLPFDRANMFHKRARVALKFSTLRSRPLKFLPLFEVAFPSSNSVLLCSRSAPPPLPHLPHADPD